MAVHTQTRPVYDNYEISGCREHGGGPGRYVEPCTDAEAQFWTLYGHINGQGVEAIGDYRSREEAEEVYYRITGQPFGSHEEIEARLQLIHAAPVLRDAFWAAIPLLVERVDLADAWSEEKVSQNIDSQFARILDAYAEATDCRRETILATVGIEQVMNADYFTFDAGDKRSASPEFDTVPDVSARGVGDAWKHLGNAHKEYTLAKHVDWRGFSQDEIGQVIGNVIAGWPKEEWFAGVGLSVGHGVSPSEIARENRDTTHREQGCGDHHCLPSPSEIARDKQAYPSEQGNSHDRGREKERG